MSLHLEEINIERLRGINNYSLKNLGQWTAITGPNSTSKSSIIQAISILGSSRMHDISDIPSWIKHNKVNPLEVPIAITYLFKLDKNFEDIMSDERIVEHLVSIYNLQLEDIQKNNIKSPTKERMIQSLTILKSKTPLGKILSDALYKTIRHEIGPNPKNTSYLPLFHSNGFYKMPDEIFNEIKFLKIRLELSLSDGPNFHFLFLDNNKKILVNEEAFYHWFQNQQAIDDDITLGYIIGSIFIKGVVSQALKKIRGEDPPTILCSDGSNIRQYIEYCLMYHPSILKCISDFFKRIFDKKIEFQKATDATSVEEGEILIEIDGDNNWFSIANLSDGMMHILKILLQLASCKKGDIIFIDEPELHLHPGAARCLRELLREKKSEIQIICATHSPIFIDPTTIDNIILNQKIKNNCIPKILNAKNIDNALTELGSSGLDSLLYDVVIWVEGPSDKIYLEKWLTLLRDEYDVPSFTQLGIFPYGSKDGLKNFKIDEIKTFNRKSIFVIDRDKEANKSIIDFITECNSKGIYCWLTKRRTIENYIPVEILEEKFNLIPGSINISFEDRIFKNKRLKKYKGKKVEFAKLITPSFTIERIKKDKDFLQELEVLIENL